MLTSTANFGRLAARRLGAVALLIVASLLPACAGTKPQAFDSPDEAVQTLVGALRADDTARLKAILGSAGEDIVSSGDQVADDNAREDFLRAFDEHHELETPDADTATLSVGHDRWPLPIPVVRSAKGRWSFDAAAGKEEILNRRIGRNELDVIEVCRAVVDAQRDYASMDPDGDGVYEYARKIISDPGRKNGLYWPAAEGEPESPLGELAAEASAEGYGGQGRRDGPRPFHGYYYRLLTSQGPHAPGGKRNYVERGYMIGGFGMVAYPAEYGNSGIMTFIVNQNGVVYQKDLGSGTASKAKSMKEFDPGEGWTAVKSAP